jgi:hypothetical protein
MRAEQGCVKDVEAYTLHGIPDSMGMEFTRCPVKSVTSKSSAYLESYKMWEKSLLPNSGGWLDQPAKVCQAIYLVEQWVRRFEKEENKDVR